MIVYEKTGYHRILLKGVILGLISWFLLCGIVNGGLNLGMEDSFIDNLVSILAHAVYGLATGWVVFHFVKKRGPVHER